MTRPDGLDVLLNEWADNALSNAAKPYAEPLVSTLPVRRRVHFHLAYAAAALVVLACAITTASLASIHRDSADRHTPHSAAARRPGRCDNHQFKVHNSKLTDAEQKLAVDLSYTGARDCTILKSPPGVTLIGVDHPFNLSNANSASGSSRSFVLVRPRAMVSFTIQAFHTCIALPAGHYRISVDLQSSDAPTADGGVSIPVGHLDPSPLLCVSKSVGIVSDPIVTG